MFLKRGGEMGNGGIAEHHGNFGDAKTFLIEKISGMLHTLALVEIENGSTEHLLEAFFQIAFIDGDLPAQGFDGEGFADLVEEDLPRADDLFAVCFVCQELTLESFYLFFSNHTFEAV